MNQAVQLLWRFSCVALFDCSSCLCNQQRRHVLYIQKSCSAFLVLVAQIQRAGGVGAVPAVD